MLCLTCSLFPPFREVPSPASACCCMTVCPQVDGKTCSGHGVCLPSLTGPGQCSCATEAGWVGTSCDSCAPGFAPATVDGQAACLRLFPFMFISAPAYAVITGTNSVLPAWALGIGGVFVLGAAVILTCLVGFKVGRHFRRQSQRRAGHPMFAGEDSGIKPNQIAPMPAMAAPAPSMQVDVGHFMKAVHGVVLEPVAEDGGQRTTTTAHTASAGSMQSLSNRGPAAKQRQDSDSNNSNSDGSSGGNNNGSSDSGESEDSSQASDSEADRRPSSFVAQDSRADDHDDAASDSESNTGTTEEVTSVHSFGMPSAASEDDVTQLVNDQLAKGAASVINAANHAPEPRQGLANTDAWSLGQLPI